ncbi:hypothetical protein DL96DRAFT_1451655, partial [Flagelloscypha sp. PMI_526]
HLCNGRIYTHERLCNYLSYIINSTPKYENTGEGAHYGDTSLIAQDLDLDLIAVSVGSHLHFKAVTPALKVGKNVFVEWPAGANLKETEALAALAKVKGVRTLVGLQG